MPKRVSNDIDHVPIEPPTKKAKKAPPKQWQLPKCKPQAIIGALVKTSDRNKYRKVDMVVSFVAFHFVIIYGVGRIILMRFSNDGVGRVWRIKVWWGKIWWGRLPLKRARTLAAEGIRIRQPTSTV